MLDSVVVAHAKWFVELTPLPSPDWGFLLDSASVLLLAAVSTAALAFGGLARRPLRQPRPLRRLLGRLQPLRETLERLQPVMPRLLAAAMGLSLLALAIGNRFLAPNLSLADVTGGWAAALAEAAVGAWLVSGVRLRLAAAGSAALALLQLWLFGPVAVLESAHLLGIAVFLALAPSGHGRLSAQATVWQDRAVLALRLGVAVSLVAVAVSEKLANPAITAAVMQAHPQLNVTRLLGLGLDTVTFVRVAASVEVLLGLLIASGGLPRLVAAATAGPFVATLPMFGLPELIGHLPFYGALLGLAVYGATSTRRRRTRQAQGDRTAARPARVLVAAGVETGG